MAEIADTTTASPEAPVQGVGQLVSNPAAASSQTFINTDHTQVKGRFNQYQSGYWSLALPLLSARYMADAVNEILLPIFKFKPRIFPKWADRAWPVVVGAAMMLVTGFYTSRTYGDMKREFKEALGWEFNKDPEKISIFDMARSENTLVHDAMKNLTKRTALRFAVHIPFFLNLKKTPFSQQQDESLEKFQEREQIIKPKGAVNFGVGTNAMYLATDALSRKQTFFEELQNLIDLKLNHNGRVGESVTAADLINLYDRQARTNPSVMPLPKMDTPEWQNDMKLFERMANLMNQTYGNMPNTEQANFTVPKLIYLLGMGLEKSDNLEKNLAYVEVANSYGIPEVKKLAQAINTGANIQEALAAYPKVFEHGTLTDITADDNAMLQSMGIAAEPVTEAPEKKFQSEALKKPRPDALPASFTEKAVQKPEGVLTVGG